MGTEIVISKATLTAEVSSLASKYINVDRLVGLTLEAYKRPDIAECTKESIIGFCKKCVEFGTDKIGPGGIWPVVFRSKSRGAELQAIPDWRFLIQRAKALKLITHAVPEVVYENETITIERGLVPVFRHVITIPRKGQIKAAYLEYTLPDGTKDFVIMDKEELDAIRDRSPAWRNAKSDDERSGTIWGRDEGEMCKKTVVKRGLKPFEGASPELSKLLEHDNALTGYEKQEEKVLTASMIEVSKPGQDAIATVQDAPSSPVSEQPAPKPQATYDTPKDMSEMPEGVLTTTGIIGLQGVKSKSYWVKIGNDIYSAFASEHKITNKLEEAKEQGLEVTVWYKEKTIGGKKYKNIVDVDISGGGQSQEENANTEEAEEELPF